MKNRTILIIDDDMHIGNMLEEVLLKEGYGVLRAYSGTEALFVISANSKPDLILLDLMLPGLSGEELLPKLKGVPVIVVSAKLDIDNKVELLLGGAVDYVTKPFNIRELLARIEIHLRSAAFSKSDVSEQALLRFQDITLNTDTHVVNIGLIWRVGSVRTWR